MSLYAPRKEHDPEQKQSGHVKLQTIDEYLEWGAQVVSTCMDHHMLSHLDNKLPYFPAYADDAMTTDDAAHWSKLASNIVLAEFRANEVHKPAAIVEYNPSEFRKMFS